MGELRYLVRGQTSNEIQFEIKYFKRGGIQSAVISSNSTQPILQYIIHLIFNQVRITHPQQFILPSSSPPLLNFIAPNHKSYIQYLFQNFQFISVSQIFKVNQIFTQHVMKTLTLIALLFVVCFSAADEEEYHGPSEEDVIVLDKDNLESTIYESEDTWLLELYAPWCGHCKTLRPEWAKLATQLKGVAKVAKIDASVNRQFDQTYGLKGYPHVVLIPGGPKDKKVYTTYEGARTAFALAEWTKQQIQVNKGFMVERLISEDKWNENCVGLKIPLCVIVFLPSLLDSTVEERTVYLEMVRGVVNNFRDKPVSFMWAQAGDHQELQDTFALNAGFPSVILINPMRTVFSIMRSSFSEQNLEQWLKDILNRKGGRKFGRYHKALAFGTVDQSVEEARQPQLQINDEAPEQL